MRRTVALGSMMIALPILMIAGTLFSIHIYDNEGVLIAMFAFIVWLVVLFMLIAEIQKED